MKDYNFKVGDVVVYTSPFGDNRDIGTITKIESDEKIWADWAKTGSSQFARKGLLRLATKLEKALK